MMRKISAVVLILIALHCNRSNAFNGQRTKSRVDMIPQTRRSFVAASILASGWSQIVQPVVAKYGDSSNLELPNYIEFLEEKNKSIDPSKFLYQGDDLEVVLKHLMEANSKLALIPSLAEQKKWSQIQGVLTGPLGTLAITMNQVASKSPEAVKEAAKKVKNDVIAIGQAAQKKSESGCVGGSKTASADLNEFLKLAFSSSSK